MEKIKLTQEQADVIESLKGRDRNFSRLVKKHLEGWRTKRNRCLNDLNVGDFCKSILVPGSYEVIPQFNVGDWVVATGRPSDFYNYPTKITDVDNINEGYIETDKFTSLNIGYFRYATSEEEAQEKKRRFWEKLGREVSGWMEGDIVSEESNDRSITFLQQYEIERGCVHFPEDRSNIPIEKIRLITPVEQRLDK
ncbi:hypothetical protein [Oceanobacillus sojae]|uniref:hypothetical protein n=1 Tax=Oceanobacillus sojae TaxID=582851 RepID=UPI0021A6E0AD|nr:hypothetical protein [Oceanobacillus sojae]MCT1904083.1 hypothetical protein [Oceanobacillus sojae]